MLNQHTHTGSSCSSLCRVSAHMDLPLSICECVQLCVNCFLLSVLLLMTHCLYLYVCVSVCVCVWKRNRVRGERDASRVYYLCEACGRKKESCCVYTRERACVCPFKHLPSALESDLSLQGINISLDNFLAADKQQLARAQPFEPCVISFNQGTELQFLAGTLGFFA